MVGQWCFGEKLWENGEKLAVFFEKTVLWHKNISSIIILTQGHTGMMKGIIKTYNMVPNWCSNHNTKVLYNVYMYWYSFGSIIIKHFIKCGTFKT